VNSRSRGIILKCVKYGEADLILQILNAQGEKQSFIAKAALKSKKRFGGGVLQPTHFIDFSYKKTQSELLILEEAQLVNGFEKIRSDYDRLEAGFFLLETILKVSVEGDSFGVALFDLLGNGLKALESAENTSRLKLHFGLKVLQQQGVLDSEPWMLEYLSVPLTLHGQLSPVDKIQSHIQFSWLENRMREYTTSGML
jgi:DNA repair protein RecO (recombination protein O)